VTELTANQVAAAQLALWIRFALWLVAGVALGAAAFAGGAVFELCRWRHRIKSHLPELTRELLDEAHGRTAAAEQRAAVAEERARQLAAAVERIGAEARVAVTPVLPEPRLRVHGGRR
jgi:hypothetical protein